MDERQEPIPSTPTSRLEPASRRLSSPIMIGREDDLSSIHAALSEAPCVAVVRGEAGVGKTRFVEEICSHPTRGGKRILKGACYELRDPFPFGPILDAFSDALPDIPLRQPLPASMGALRTLLPDLADLLPPSLAVDDPFELRHSQFRALMELIDRARVDVLVLEDLHWASQSTSEFVVLLAANMPEQLSLVLTYRNELPPTSPLLKLRERMNRSVNFVDLLMERLNPPEVARLVGAILSAPSVSDDFAEYLFEKTAGLPFAIEEVLLLLRDRNNIVWRNGVWARRALDRIEIPASLGNPLVNRVQGLGNDARRAVEVTAVNGEAVDEVVISRILSWDEPRTAEALAEALQAAILVESPEGTVSFRHDLARLAVYQSIPGPLQRDLHRRCTAWILEDRPTEYARLAHHHRQTGSMTEWLECCEQAADQASDRGHLSAAFEYLRDVVAEDDVPLLDRARLASKWIEPALVCVAHEEAIPVIQSLLAQSPPDRRLRGSLRLGLAGLFRQAGKTSATYAALRGALPDLDEMPIDRARAMANLAVPWVREGHLEEHMLWLDKARQTCSLIDEADRFNVEADIAAVLIYVAEPSGWDELRRLIGGQRPASGRSGRNRLLHNAAVGAVALGDFRRADAILALGGGTPEGDDLRFLAFTEGTRLLLDWFQGSWNGLGERAAQRAQSTGSLTPVFSVDATLVMGLLACAEGRTGEAARLLGDVHRLNLEVGGIPLLHYSAAALARIEIAVGNPEQGLATAMGALDIVRTKGLWVWGGDAVPVAVEALIALDGLKEADELTAEFEEGVSDRPAPSAHAGLALARAMVLEAAARVPEALSLIDRYRQIWQESNRPLETIRADEVAGRMLLPSDRAAGARLITKAIASYKSLGSIWDARRLTRMVRGEGVVVGHHRGRRGYGSDLSPREKEVVTLARSGMTNKEISAVLFVTPKTVENTLGRAMRKLGVSSRSLLPSVEDPTGVAILPG